MKRHFLFAALCLGLISLAGCGGGAAQAVPLTADAAWAAPGDGAEQLPPSYDIYEPFGLEYDAASDALYFDGRRVRYFRDGVDIGNGGQISRTEHIDRLGTVDVHTLRETVDNGDGSVDPFGPLTGLEADSEPAFKARDIGALLHPALEATTGCSESGGDPGISFADRFAAYREFGIEFVESPDSSGKGNVYFLGELVHTFADISESGTFVFHSLDGGSCNVRTAYDRRGMLSGVERSSQN